MRTWQVPLHLSMSFQLAADARLTIPDYVDDQIWEFALAGEDPPALCLSTSYGLRARSMRLYAGFGREAEYVTDPSRFASPPVLRLILPNYLRADFSPFPKLEVHAEVWVPDSHSLAGRFRIQNQDSSPHRVRLVMHAVLRPGENPRPMSEELREGATILAGHTADLHPVLFLAGGASVALAPHPALAVTHEFEPGATKAIHWAQAGLGDVEQSFEAARNLVGRPWDEEIARLEMVNASQVDIESGEPDWDLAFALAQRTALGAFLGPTRHLPQPSFVQCRLPDRGYSQRGDGRDYSLDWDGQTALAAFSVGRTILPAAPEWAKGLVRNFLSTQAADGSIDGKPGLGGQRSGTLAAPLLASLAWRIYQHTDDRPFLEECFSPLLEFLGSWFSPAHDCDQDGHPEWDHTVHAGFDDWPTFVRWGDWGQGLDITKAETPDLASYLHRECLSLIAAARELGREEAVGPLLERAERLRQAVQASWSDASATYHHLDRDEHRTPVGEVLGQGRGEFKLSIDKAFDPEARLLFRTVGPEGQSRAIQVTVKGRSTRGRESTERLLTRDFQWFWDRGTATSTRTYAVIESVEVRGLAIDFATEVWAADYSRQDASVLLPLWAGIPDSSHAGWLIDRALTDPARFWRSYGIPVNSAQDPAYAPDHRSGVGAIWMLWNEMLGEGLLTYGRRGQAAELTARLMGAVVEAIRRDGAFRQWYHPDRAEAFGERDHLAGLAPLPLFLSVLGVRLISPRKVWLEGSNPFPWPITLRWRGLEVRREPNGPTTVTFPDGGHVELTGEEPRIIEQGDGFGPD